MREGTPRGKEATRVTLAGSGLEAGVEVVVHPARELADGGA